MLSVIAMDDLRRYLATLPPGPIKDDATLRRLLSEAWSAFAVDLGPSDTAKVWRAEGFEWRPPVLAFDIERHGGTVLGSTRAELQHWEADVETGTARFVREGRRQLYPIQQAFDTARPADELAEAIRERRADPRLTWSKNGRVRVRTSTVLPEACKQTTEGRRKRLIRDLTKRLPDWTRRGSWWELTV
jgi:hypothetical protein